MVSGARKRVGLPFFDRDFVTKTTANLWRHVSRVTCVGDGESDDYHELPFEGVSLSSSLTTEEAQPLRLSNWGCYLCDMITHPELHD